MSAPPLNDLYQSNFVVSNNYCWLTQTIAALNQGQCTHIDGDRLVKLLAATGQAQIQEASNLTQSILEHLLLLQSDFPQTHRLKGQILRDRAKLQQLLILSPSLEIYLQQQLKSDLSSINWEQINSPDFFG